MAKRVDLKAKQKRQKIIAAVGAVILLGVVVIQGPKMWKLLHQKAPETAAPATAAPPTGSAIPLAAPTTAGGAPTPSAGSGGELSDSDPAPLPSQSQLLSFSRFATKDPFAEQVNTENGAAVVEPAAQPSKKGTSTAPGGAVTVPGKREPARPATPAPAPTSATIAVNGVAETVSTGKDFPAAEPIFRLVSLTRKAAKISIAGGSFASGKPTMTLELGKTVTLMNTADGTRYELRLVSVA